MSGKHAEPRADSVNSSFPVSFLRESTAVARTELMKIFRDPTELFSRAAQPLLWLLVFGQVFGQVRGIPTGGFSYAAFLTPGILAQSVLFSSIFYGIAVIWEKDLGLVHKLLVTPASRRALVAGKAIAAGFRGLSQATIIYFVTLVAGIELSANPIRIAGVVVAVFLGSGIFATFSFIIACLVKTRERFMGIGQLLTMPLFFASNAIYPVELMPSWLRIVATVNPLTYLVDSMRSLMLGGAFDSHSILLDFGVMGVLLFVLIMIAGRLYPSLAR